jgi:hypothetical protein
VIRVDGTMQARTVIDVDGAVPRPRPELER